jgi:hemin uptake protein HemP
VTVISGETDRKRTKTVSSVRRVSVSELLGEGREAVLLHDGTEYRLRLTSNGKLILTK